MTSDYNRAMTGFTKLFSSLVHSTVWREEMHIKVVWITMLAMANRNGRVIASLPGLADAARVSVEQCEEAITKFLGPDKWSRTKANDGRRICEIDGGWELLNYQKYREMRDEAERAIQTRDAVRRYRERKKANNITVSHGKPLQAQAEAEAEAENKQQSTSASADALAVYNHWLERANTEQRSGRVRSDTLKRIASRLKDGFSVDDLKRAVDVACWDEFYVKQGYYRQPAVIWRNAERVQSLLSKAQHEAARPIPL